MNVLDLIALKINKIYNGTLNCEQERADLFVYKDGVEINIKEINSTHVIFEDFKIKLIDCDIQWLLYINNSI